MYRACTIQLSPIPRAINTRNTPHAPELCARSTMLHHDASSLLLHSECTRLSSAAPSSTSMMPLNLQATLAPQSSTADPAPLHVLCSTSTTAPRRSPARAPCHGRSTKTKRSIISHAPQTCSHLRLNIFPFLMSPHPVIWVQHYCESAAFAIGADSGILRVNGELELKERPNLYANNNNPTSLVTAECFNLGLPLHAVVPTIFGPATSGIGGAGDCCLGYWELELKEGGVPTHTRQQSHCSRLRWVFQGWSVRRSLCCWGTLPHA